MSDNDMYDSHEAKTKKGWSTGWKGRKQNMDIESMKAAKDYTSTVHSHEEIDQNQAGGDNTSRLKHMIQLRADASKAAKRLEGDHGYDIHPERTVKHLEDIELLSTGRSVRLPIMAAHNLQQQVLESTARIRKLRDTIARNAIDKEEELVLVMRQIHDAEKIGMNRFVGAKGEDKLNKRYSKTKKKLLKIQELCEVTEFMSKKLNRMKYHLNNSLRKYHINNGMLERQLIDIYKSEGHARRKRLELYQSLSFEKRNLDLIGNKVLKIRTVQNIKLDEVTKCGNDQNIKFIIEQKKSITREKRMSMQLDSMKKKLLINNVSNMFKMNTKTNAIDHQLAPLEDVFYKIKVRTGLANLTAEHIAELYISQNDSLTLLRNECSNAMIKINDLKDKFEEKNDKFKRLQQAGKETNRHKSFYAELDVVEKELHDHIHKNERAAEIARHAKLNVTCLENFIKKISRELQNLRLDKYVEREIPINLKTIDHSNRDGNYQIGLLEIHRIVGVLSNHVKEMSTIGTSSGSGSGSGGSSGSSSSSSGGGSGSSSSSGSSSGVPTLSLPSSGGGVGEPDSSSFSISTKGGKRGKRGTTQPTMTMDHVAVSPISSPMKSHEGSVARAHAVARAAAASSQRVQHSTGNIRVATKIATEANGYDSDLEESIGNGGGGNGGGSNGGGSGSGNAWETPRDGVSLRGNGGGIRRSRNNSKAPSETSESNKITSLFGDDLNGGPLSGGPSNGVIGLMSLPQQQEEEDRACQTVRQQMKQVTSMVMYRARKNDSKKGGKKDKDGDDNDSSNSSSSNSSSSKSKKTFELPKSPRRRSIMIDNDEEDDFTRLIGAMGAESALGLKTKRGHRGGGGDASGSGMKPKKPKGKKSNGGRRGSVMRKNRKTKSTSKRHKLSSPSISASSEF